MTIGPALEPVSLSDAKQHIRVSHDHDDRLITELISAARLHTEFVCGQKLLTQSWRQYETCLPIDRIITSQLSPVQSVEAVTVFDIDGTPAILAASQFVVHHASDPKALELMPTVSAQSAHNGLEIDWIVGMSDIPTELPSSLRRAVLMLVSHWYEFRGAVDVSSQPVSLPIGFDALTRPFRRVKL